MQPGRHEVRSGWAQVAIDARRRGMEIRDCVLVVGPEGVSTTWLLRVPLAGTVVEGALIEGVGGLHIDSCRVSTTDNLNGGAYGGSDRADGYEVWRYKRTGGAGAYVQPLGRWPSNTVLVHGPACRQDGTKRVRASGGHYDKLRGDQGTFAQDEWTKTRMRNGTTDHAGPDGKEAVAVWACGDGCLVPVLDEQSGERTSGVLKAGTRRGVDAKQVFSGGGSFEPGAVAAMRDFGGDSGGASRYFAQLQGEELEGWLACLIGRGS